MTRDNKKQAIINNINAGDVFIAELENGSKISGFTVYVGVTGTFFGYTECWYNENPPESVNIRDTIFVGDIVSLVAIKGEKILKII